MGGSGGLLLCSSPAAGNTRWGPPRVSPCHPRPVSPGGGSSGDLVIQEGGFASARPLARNPLAPGPRARSVARELGNPPPSAPRISPAPLWAPACIIRPLKPGFSRQGTCSALLGGAGNLREGPSLPPGWCPVPRGGAHAGEPWEKGCGGWQGELFPPCTMQHNRWWETSGR